MSAEVGSAPGLAGAGRAPDMPQRVTTAAHAWCLLAAEGNGPCSGGYGTVRTWGSPL